MSQGHNAQTQMCYNFREENFMTLNRWVCSTWN